MEGVSPKTLCGRSTDDALVHDGEWVDAIINGDLERATSVCAKCRSIFTKPAVAKPTP